MFGLHNPLHNRLLGALPLADYRRLEPHLEPVAMRLGAVLYESGSRHSHIYFPTTSIVSLLYVMADGASSETAAVGKEGIVGVPLFTGGLSMPNRGVVRNAGYGFRLKEQILKQEFNRLGALHDILLRYTQALLTQMAQTAVCNRHHSVSQQLCRWLLLSLDRLNSNELNMTQELIANMLGVRREGITEAARKLQQSGIISYCRGHITVLDRVALEAKVCECYQVLRREFERLLPDENIRTNLPSLAEQHPAQYKPTYHGNT
jgi:CRP-like cAMP-binding protein